MEEKAPDFKRILPIALAVLVIAAGLVFALVFDITSPNIEGYYAGIITNKNAYPLDGKYHIIRVVKVERELTGSNFDIRDLNIFTCPGSNKADELFLLDYDNQHMARYSGGSFFVPGNIEYIYRDNGELMVSADKEYGVLYRIDKSAVDAEVNKLISQVYQQYCNEHKDINVSLYKIDLE